MLKKLMKKKKTFADAGDRSEHSRGPRSAPLVNLDFASHG
jgi:hypothetical protein